MWKQKFMILNRKWNRLRKKWTICGGIFELDSKKDQLKDLEKQSQDPKVWKDHKLLSQIAKEKSIIERNISEWQNIHLRLEDNLVLVEMLQEEPVEQSFLDLKKEYDSLMKQIQELELKSFLDGPYDKNDCYVSIHAGAGGTEAADWAGILQRMYFRWAEDRKFSIDILSLSAAEEAGIRSVHFLVKGFYAYGYLQAENGVHRLIRISPFDANARRHTSFASVFVWPEVDDNIEINIKEEEIRVDTYRASGAGGQHINKTDSAVRITHLPTGIVVQCQNQRSQHANRNQSLKMLKAALYNREEEKRKQEKKSVQSSQKANEWGSQIRSYVLHPYQMVKDHRTGLEKGDPSSVLGGDLDLFISSWLKSKER